MNPRNDLLSVVCRHIVMRGVLFVFVSVPVFAADSTDVTSVVAAALQQNKVSIAANNQTFGDTAPGIPKKLRVEYRIGDEKFSRETNEGGSIEISAPEGKELVITKAVYGPADGSKPVDLGNPEEFLDTLPGFKIELVLQADAKSNGSWICMTKDPQGRLLLGGLPSKRSCRFPLRKRWECCLSTTCFI